MTFYCHFGRCSGYAKVVIFGRFRVILGDNKPWYSDVVASFGTLFYHLGDLNVLKTSKPSSLNVFHRVLSRWNTNPSCRDFFLARMNFRSHQLCLMVFDHKRISKVLLSLAFLLIPILRDDEQRGVCAINDIILFFWLLALFQTLRRQECIWSFYSFLDFQIICLW